MEASPASPSEVNENKDLKALISFYSNYLWTRVLDFLPSPDYNFLRRIRSRAAASRRRHRRRACLPLPLPANLLDSCQPATTEASRVLDVLHEILERTFSNLNNVQKNLQFWESRAEVSNFLLWLLSLSIQSILFHCYNFPVKIEIHHVA